MAQTIPITNDYNQRLDININGVRYEFRISYNVTVDRYSLSIYQNQQPLVVGIIMTSGVDLIRHTTLELPAIYFVNTADITQDITRDNFDEGAALMLVEDGELG